MRTLPEGMRENVLGAAELFAELGLDATKMEDVAAATGVPKATLYYYFEGKEEILAFLFVHILDELGRAARSPLIAEQTGAAFVEPVRQLLAQGVRDGSLAL